MFSLIAKDILPGSGRRKKTGKNTTASGLEGHSDFLFFSAAGLVPFCDNGNADELASSFFLLVLQGLFLLLFFFVSGVKFEHGL